MAKFCLFLISSLMISTVMSDGGSPGTSEKDDRASTSPPLVPTKMFWQKFADAKSITIKKVTTCSKPNDLFVLKKTPAVTPPTIIPGETIKLSFSALLKENVTGGDIKISISVSGFPLYDYTLDLCDTLALSQVVKCPVKAGPFDYENPPLQFAAPSSLKIPVGEFLIEASVTDGKERELICLQVVAEVN